MANEENFYSANETFSVEKGFYLSAAVTKYNGDSSSIEDPTIATLKFYMKSWDIYDPSTSGGLEWTEVKTKNCTANDFNDIDGSNTRSKFYPTNPMSELEV